MGNLSTNPMCPCTKIEISLAKADVAFKYELIYEAVFSGDGEGIAKTGRPQLGIAKTASLHQAVSRGFGASFMCCLCQTLSAPGCST